MIEWKVDVVLVSEPNKKLMEDEAWITDEDKNLAIKVYNHTKETSWTKRGKRRRCGYILRSSSCAL